MLQSTKQDWIQKTVATISAISVAMSASTNSLCSKYVNEGMVDMKQTLLNAELPKSYILDF